jgi:uncharacterized zinc-type alcohol dehydrogenase-like protein
MSLHHVHAVGVKDTLAEFENIKVPLRPVSGKDVLVKVLYCGICHSDVHQARAEWMMPILYPMVPGHEIAGVVEQVGDQVTKVKVGDTVGVGCMVGACRNCEQCKRGNEQYCDQGMIGTYNGTYDDGTPTYGGYSQKLVVDEHFVLIVPKNMNLEKVGPILCAGITMWSPLVHFGARENGAKWKVGIHGLGGLGHMGVKLAKAMGCTVTAISRGTAKRESALQLGAQEYVDSTDPESLKKASRLDLIVSTVSGSMGNWHDILGLLKTEGKLVLVGAPPAPIAIPAFSLIGGRKTLAGSLIGGIQETQELLYFCSEHNIYPEVALINADQVNEAFCDIVEGKGDNYRYVLKIAETLNENTVVKADKRQENQHWEVQGFVIPPESKKLKLKAKH